MRTIVTLIFFTVISNTCWSLEIGGIEMPSTLKTGNQKTLELNGAGIRNKWFIDLYVAGLYLPQPSQEASKILDSDEPMAIRLHIISGMINSKKLTNAKEEGFKNSTGGNTEPFADNIERFLGQFKDEISEGDVFEFIYQPASGVTVSKNDGPSQLIDCDFNFKKALFGIWLSDKPAQKSLKESMLNL